MKGSLFLVATLKLFVLKLCGFIESLNKSGAKRRNLLALLDSETGKAGGFVSLVLSHGASNQSNVMKRKGIIQ